MLDHQGQRGGAALLELSQRAPTPIVAGETTASILVYHVVIRGIYFLGVVGTCEPFLRSSVAKCRNSNNPKGPPLKNKNKNKNKNKKGKESPLSFNSAKVSKRQAHGLPETRSIIAKVHASVHQPDPFPQSVQQAAAESPLGRAVATE